MNKTEYEIGVISDTHGRLHPGVMNIFKDVDHIIHAGDVCGSDIIEELGKLAQVTAVKGNMDSGKLSLKLNATESVKIGPALIYVLHIPGMLDIIPHERGFNVVITGHTHIPLVKTEDGVLYLNPGSATCPKHQNSPTAAMLHINTGGGMHAEIIPLE